jgi:MFS family permease
MDRYVLNAVRSPLAADLGIGYGDSGRLFTAFMLGYFVTSPFFGYLGDRVSRKKLIALGIAVWSLGTVLSGTAAGFASLVFFRVLVGTGEAAYATLSPAMISDEWGPERRNNALTIFYAAIPLGSAIGYVFGGEMAAHWGWRSAFLWAGIPGLLLAMVLLPFEEPRRGESDGPALIARPSVTEIFRLFRNADYNLVVWGYVAYTFALGAFAFWGPTFLEKVHHLSTAHADRFFGAAITVGGLAGTLLGGFAATAWHRRNPAAYAWVMSGSMFLAAPLSVAALRAGSPSTCMSLLALAIFLLFLSTGPVNTLILETVPINLRAGAMAMSIFSIHLFGDMWSPEMIGRLADRLGGDLQKAVLLLPAVLLVAGVIWLALALKTATPRPGRLSTRTLPAG